MGTTLTLNPSLRQQIIEAALEQLSSCYVFPEVAAAMATDIRRRLEAGEYDSISDGPALRDALTIHLRQISHDLHLRLVYHTEPQPERMGSAYEDPAWLERYWEGAALDNHGVYRAERLAGNIGLIDLRSIDEAEYTAETLAAAMALLARTSALIIDLRQNNGGAPSGVAFLCSYFVGLTPVHVNNIYSRPTDTTQQFWTVPHLPGPRYLDRPVYMLTGARTFSGAEELAYNLQALGRATLVGQQTAGGANPVEVYQLHPHFDLRVPVARAINPITGTNWEGTGVTPDVATAEQAALDVAYRLALGTVISRYEHDEHPPLQQLVAEARAALAELG